MGITAFILTRFAFWLAGYDIFQRSTDSGIAFGASLAIGLIAHFVEVWQFAPKTNKFEITFKESRKRNEQNN